MQFYILVVILLTGVFCSSMSNDVLLAKIEALEKKYDAKIEEYDSRMEEYDSEIVGLKGKLAAQDSTSFFSVQLDEDTIVAHNFTVPFDRVIVNYGGDFIQSGGIYIAPVDGYYMFTLVVREVGSDHCAGSVVRTLASDPDNTVMLCRAEQGDNENQTGSCTVIAEMTAGDQVSVLADGLLASVASESSSYLADGYTSLSGLLLRAGLE